MDHLLYIAASGARETMVSQAVNANNLANASTVGFRADLLSAASAYVVGDGHASRTYGALKGRGPDLTEGVVENTGRDLDLAINGQGWMAVVGPDGAESYTRRGDLRVTEYGQLLNGAGEAVLGNAGPIALPPFSELEVGGDGTISIVPVGEAPNTLVVVDRIKLVNPDPATLVKNRDGVIKLADGGEATPSASVRLVSGALESSNVNTVASMVEMIELSRAFEMHIKMIKTAENLDRSSAELMRLS